MYYASFGLLAMALHIIINLELIRPSKMKISKVMYNYRCFLFAIFVYYLTDVLWGILYERGFLILAYVDTVIYFLSMVMSLILWTRFVVSYLDHKGRFGKALTLMGWVITIYEVIVLIVNLFIPVVFSFNEEGIYVPGNGRYISLVAQIVLFVFTSIYAFYGAGKSEGRRKTHYLTVASCGIVMTLFIVLQTVFPLLPFYAVGCLITSCLVHTFINNDEKRVNYQALNSARQIVTRDALTGVKSVHAYTEAKDIIQQRLNSGDLKQFGVIVFDLNGLKRVNDTFGHEEGDKYIKTGCMLICKKFQHSPVFRIGGDEFVVILEGDDYDDRVSLLDEFDRQIEDNRENGLVTISSGMDIYDANTDSGFNSVFERADKKMYERKKALKGEI